MTAPAATTLPPHSTLGAHVRPLRVVDLFSGLNGWTAPFRDHGHHVFSIDFDERFDAASDVGEVDVAE